MLGWALRTLAIWLCLGAAGYYGWQSRATLLAMVEVDAPAASPPAEKPTILNTLRYPVGANGHVVLDAAVNGSPVRFMLDTGASYVTLTPEAAEAAGLTESTLRFSKSVATANGVVRVAPVRLREMRIGQLTMEDVDAVVVETPLPISLLGMSFLKRLDSYGMRDGAFVINW